MDYLINKTKEIISWLLHIPEVVIFCVVTFALLLLVLADAISWESTITTLIAVGWTVVITKMVHMRERRIREAGYVVQRSQELKTFIKVSYLPAYQSLEKLMREGVYKSSEIKKYLKRGHDLLQSLSNQRLEDIGNRHQELRQALDKFEPSKTSLDQLISLQIVIGDAYHSYQEMALYVGQLTGLMPANLRKRTLSKWRDQDARMKNKLMMLTTLFGMEVLEQKIKELDSSSC